MTTFQSVPVDLPSGMIDITLPSSDAEVLPGVAWGAAEAFPSPAYWTYQVLARRMRGGMPSHRLGETLMEEVAACLLGGHGIPASVGLAAFSHLRNAKVLSGPTSREELDALLRLPLLVEGRKVHYRFAGQKARYLSAALVKLSLEIPPQRTGRALRDWLMQLPGIGPKTASWVARNWLDADDVAILDIHILRAGKLAGFLDSRLSVERDYLKLEAQFLRFSEALGVRASELDAIIWQEMMASQRTVTKLMGGNLGQALVAPDKANSRLPRRRTQKGRANPKQARLFK